MNSYTAVNNESGAPLHFTSKPVGWSNPDTKEWSVPIWNHLLLDRVGITIVLSSGDLYKHVYGQLFSMEEEQGQFLPDGKIKIRKNKYSTRLDYYPKYTHKISGRRKIADITVGANILPGKVTLHRYLTLTLYPSQFRGQDFKNFQWVFNALFDPITYPKLFQAGKVNYLELAADSLSHLHHSFLPYRKYCSKSQIYQDGTGYFGTTYIGSKTSALRFRLYDKGKQLVDTGKSPSFKVLPHTRIEAVMRRLGIAPVDLIHMGNPFEKLLIADLDQAKATCKNDDWQTFLVECQTNGVQNALSMRSPDVRKKYLGMLDKIPVSWWPCALIWAGLPDTLAVIAPEPCN